MLSTMMQCAGRIRVKDCPFGAPDGVASQFQLVDRHGHPVTKDVRIQSIHQTDWQGRVELSSEARTNIIPSPSDLSTFGSSNMSSVSVGASEGPDGTMSMCRLVADNSGASSGFTSPGLSVAVGASVLSSIIVRRTQNRYINLAGFSQGSSGCTFDLQDLTWQPNANWHSAGVVEIDEDFAAIWAVTEIPSGSNKTAWFTISTSPSGNTVTTGGETLDVGFPQVMVGEVVRGVFIPVGQTPVTDYTHDGAGGITTGQVPEDGAELDWSGTARRAA